MSFVLTLFLVLFLSNSRELTPIHIWVIEFFVLGFIVCIIGIGNEKWLDADLTERRPYRIYPAK